jgi:hypothetical protein
MVASLFGVVAGVRAVGMGFPSDGGGHRDEGGREGGKAAAALMVVVTWAGSHNASRW